MLSAISCLCLFSGEQEGTLLGVEWDGVGNAHKLHTQEDETQHHGGIDMDWQDLECVSRLENRNLGWDYVTTPTMSPMKREAQSMGRWQGSQM